MKTHGHWAGNKPSPTMATWRGIVARCTNPNATGFKNYGGRGITLDPRWNPKEGGSFENFLADMGGRPPGTTIERKDKDAGYCQANCTWVSAKEQARNRRSTVTVSVNGQLMTATEIALAAGISVTGALQRIRKGWQGSQLLQEARR